MANDSFVVLTGHSCLGCIWSHISRDLSSVWENPTRVLLPFVWILSEGKQGMLTSTFLCFLVFCISSVWKALVVPNTNQISTGWAVVPVEWAQTPWKASTVTQHHLSSMNTEVWCLFRYILSPGTSHIYHKRHEKMQKRPCWYKTWKEKATERCWSRRDLESLPTVLHWGPGFHSSF